MIASCKRRDDLLAEYITLTECSKRQHKVIYKRGKHVKLFPLCKVRYLVQYKQSLVFDHDTARVEPRGFSQIYPSNLHSPLHFKPLA